MTLQQLNSLYTQVRYVKPVTKAKNKVLSPEEFRQHLIRQGKTLKQWAEERNLDSDYCSRILCGQIKGNRGKGHEIAVAMRLKAKPIPLPPIN